MACQRAQTSLGWSWRLKRSVENSHIAHFEFGMVKNGYIWSFPKADGYSIGIGTFRGEEDFKSILGEYAGCLVWM